MSVSLQKGQKVDLTKGNAGLKRLIVGLGWDAAEQKKGLFGMKKASEIDCDASALVCSTGGKLMDKSDIVYFGNLRHKTGAIIHLGDNLTGEGDGDDGGHPQPRLGVQGQPQGQHQHAQNVKGPPIYCFQKKVALLIQN